MGILLYLTIKAFEEFGPDWVIGIGGSAAKAMWVFYDHVEDMSANAVTDPCTGTNPSETSVEQMKQLYIAALERKDVDF
ncbi:hypothetical protein [Terribacillus aidingensis]|uniref:hypothetical protein n=1 Tax=Terribacillus aidingensis TaxID=586416 RepID=UPI00344F2A4B